MAEVHDELNPKLWDENQQLRPEVKEKLKEITDTFIQYMKDDEVDFDVLDVNLLGSNASYNYTDKSDLDTHLVVNFENVGAPKELVQAYFNQKRTRFNTQYDLTIHGVPIELYVEDVMAGTLSNGIYSLYEDKWLKKPVKLENIPEVDVSKELKVYRKVIKDALKSKNSKYLKYILDKLFLIRRNGLAINGEYSKGNQMFKALRNEGIIDELREAVYASVSKELSLESLRRLSEGYKDSEEYKKLMQEFREVREKLNELEKSEPENDTYPSDEEMRKVCGISEDEWKTYGKYEKEAYYELLSGDREKSNHEKWHDEYSKYRDKLSELLNKMKKLSEEEFEKQDPHSFEGNPPEKATKSSYKGFKLETGEYHQDYLDNPKYAEQKGYYSVYIAEMTPDEYMERCSKEVFYSPIEDVHDGMEEKDKVHEYAEMMKNGTKFYMPYIDTLHHQQEGRHRAMAAKELGIKKIPVLYLDY